MPRIARNTSWGRCPHRPVPPGVRIKPSPRGKVARASPASARRMRAKAPLHTEGEPSECRKSPQNTLPLRTRGLVVWEFLLSVRTHPGEAQRPSLVQRELARASHASARLRDCKVSSIGGVQNVVVLIPSVMALRGTAMTAPLGQQGEPWVLPHQCVHRCFSEEPEKVPHSSFAQRHGF